MIAPRRARRPKNPLSLHDRALRLLAVRQRSRRELETRLVAAGFERVEVREELDRLESVGLVDDERFALEFAEHAATRRLSGRRAVTSSLGAKGVARDIIDRALGEVGGDEEARAADLARTRATRLMGLPPETAFRRLFSFLVRRGYDSALARRAATDALRLQAESGE